MWATMRDKRPETRVYGRPFFDCRIRVETKEDGTIVFEAPEAQFNRYCDSLLRRFSRLGGVV